MRAADLAVAAEATGELVRYALRPTLGSVRAAMEPTAGRTALTESERRMALRVDAGMRLLRARCLARSVVLTRMLRRRGIAATLSFSVSTGDARDAHAEVAVAGQPLRSHPPGNAVFR